MLIDSRPKKRALGFELIYGDFWLKITHPGDACVDYVSITLDESVIKSSGTGISVSIKPRTRIDQIGIRFSFDK